MSTSGIRDNSGIRVQVDQSRVRTAPATNFGDHLKGGLSAVADGAAGAAQIAAPFVPGAAVLSAAISGVGSTAGAVSGGGGGGTGVASASGGASSVAPNATGLGGKTGTGGSSIDKLAAGGDKSAILMQEQNRMQEMNMSFNMQYLGLQQKMQDESRRFTLLSNVMKTKHDTAKNSISNVR